MSKTSYRVGLIVPSSNTTMETEIPAMLHAREGIAPETFTFHSSRMRMMSVTPEELKQMDRDSDRCATELADARVDVMAYACLIAIMCQGPDYHCVSEERLEKTAAAAGGPAPVVSSAGALLKGLQALQARRVAIIAPYLKPLTATVINNLTTNGIEVVDSISLEIPDNLEVGRRDPMALVELADKLDISKADAVILSACVQMPSLPAIQVVQDRINRPVLSAATATTFEILRRLDLEPVVPNAGHLLSGEVSLPAAGD